VEQLEKFEPASLPECLGQLDEAVGELSQIGGSFTRE